MSDLSQRGAIQFIVLLILLLGLVGGVWLVTRGEPLKFLPKAGGGVSGPITPQTSFILNDPEATKAKQVGSEFEVQIWARSDIEPANLFAAKLQFPLHLLEVVRIEKEGSFISSWVEEYFDNNTGEVSLAGGIPAPGLSTAQNQARFMASIIFRAKDAGAAVVLFQDESAIYSNVNNINILTVKESLTVSLGSSAGSPAPTSPPPTAPGVVLYELPREFASTQGGNWFYYYKIGNSPESLLPPVQQPGTVVATTPPYEAIYGSSSMKPKDWFGASDNQYWHAGGNNWMVVDDGLSTGGDSQIALVYWEAPSAGHATVTVTEQRVEQSGKGNGFEFGVGYAPGTGKLLSTVLAKKQVSSQDSSVQTLTAQYWLKGDGDALAYYKFSNNLTYGDSSRYSIKVVFTPAAEASPTPSSSPISVVGSGDGNNDGKVNLADLSILLSNFNKTSGFPQPIDLNGDGRINSIDYSLMVQILIKAGVIKGGGIG